MRSSSDSLALEEAAEALALALALAELAAELALAELALDDAALEEALPPHAVSTNARDIIIANAAIFPTIFIFFPSPYVPPGLSRGSFTDNSISTGRARYVQHGFYFFFSAY